MTYRDHDLQMPPDEKLTDRQITDVTQWVAMGAPHPNSDNVTTPLSHGDVDIEQGRKHWAFTPPRKSPLPASIPHSGRSASPIDAFLGVKMKKRGLVPLGPADRSTLLRRATFDLIGLPPTQEERDAFLADESPDAFKRVVDRLLQSPHYGERWGRHWLDIARYADSNGSDENVAHGNAWRYRDYVIESLNDDKPYDEFLVEQLAGDLLDSGDNVSVKHQRLIATGFLVMGPKVLAEVDEARMEMDIVDEQIDTIGRGLMGLTLGCARCHTHKFDPISHHDYYALAGIFKSTRTMESFKKVAKWHESYLAPPEDIALEQEYQGKLVARKKAIKDRVTLEKRQLDPPDPTPTDIAVAEKPTENEKRFPQESQDAIKKMREDLKELQRSDPKVPSAMCVTEGDIANSFIHLRGSHLTLGDEVARRFPRVLADDDQPDLPIDRSGRLEFARWLTDGEHPLTARVMVNRIWRGHFGKGLVTTVDNFGLQGEPPTHPELLDWLAVDFVENGWSIKAMHQTILMSAAYQRSSDHDKGNATIDPDNEFYWRRDLRRLEAESIRDAMLCVSGTLDPTMGGNLMTTKNREYVFNHTSKDDSHYDTNRRSIYVPVIRNHLYDMFSLFDYTDASVLNGDRDTSTLSPQALFLMNSQQMSDVSLAMARRLIAAEPSVESRLSKLFLDAYGRSPREEEASRVMLFLAGIS